MTRFTVAGLSKRQCYGWAYNLFLLWLKPKKAKFLLKRTQFFLKKTPAALKKVGALTLWLQPVTNLMQLKLWWTSVRPIGLADFKLKNLTLQQNPVGWKLQRIIAFSTVRAHTSISLNLLFSPGIGSDVKGSCWNAFSSLQARGSLMSKSFGAGRPSYSCKLWDAVD